MRLVLASKVVIMGEFRLPGSLQRGYCVFHSIKFLVLAGKCFYFCNFMKMHVLNSAYLYCTLLNTVLPALKVTVDADILLC